MNIRSDATLTEPTLEQIIGLNEEQHIQRAVINAAAHFIIATRVDGTITLFNAAAERLLGYTAQEIIGKTTPVIFHEMEEVKEAARQISLKLGRTIKPGLELFVLTSQPGYADEQEWTFVRKDGTRFVASLSVTKLNDDEGNFIGYLGIGSDITKRKQAEEALRRSEEQFRSLSASSPVGIFQTDAQGRCLYTNARWQEIAGLTGEESMGNNWVAAVHPDDRHTVVTEWERCIREQSLRFMEFRFQHKTGEIRSVMTRVAGIKTDKGAIIGYVGTCEDITDSKRAQQSLRTSEARLAEAQSVAKVGNWELDVVTGIITGSAEMLRLLEFDPACGTPSYEVMMRRCHSDDVPMYNAIIAQAIEDGQPYTVEIRVVLDDGAIRWIHANGRGTTNDSGRVTHLFGTVQDITESRAARAEIVRARDAALEATNAKSLFLASMSHELRTPMNGVLGMAQLLMQTHMTPEQRECAEIIHSSGETLLTLLNDILDLSKIEADKLELESAPFDMRKIVQDTTQLFSQIASRRGIRMTCHIDPDVPLALVGDMVRVRQVLSNLVSNAIKFTEQGDVTVTVRLKRIEAERYAWICVSVSDSGIGIDERGLARLFQHFSQADASTTRRYGGTGLGLAISRRLTELMGGEIEVESTPGKGSTFSFTLRLEQSQAIVPATEIPWVLPDLSSVKILVAEDNRTNQIVIRRYLKRRGCYIKIVDHGRAVLDALEAETFDLVLMDCHMPEMDGYEVTRRIRAREEAQTSETRPRLLIIALTASAMDNDRERCLAVGMNDFMTKPIQFRQLDNILQKWLSALESS